MTRVIGPKWPTTNSWQNKAKIYARVRRFYTPTPPPTLENGQNSRRPSDNNNNNKKTRPRFLPFRVRRIRSEAAWILRRAFPRSSIITTPNVFPLLEFRQYRRGSRIYIHTRGRSDKYIASPSDGASIAKEIYHRVVYILVDGYCQHFRLVVLFRPRAINRHFSEIFLFLS